MTYIKIILLFTLVFFSSKLFSQCFEIESILVDACGSPEGENEMVRFRVGDMDLNTSFLIVSWPNTMNPWLGTTQNATTGLIVASLNATILSCGFLKEPVGGVLPAFSKVLLITSTAIDVSANSFENLSDTMYVIFQTAGNTSGHFANYNATPGLRTLTMSFNPPVGCTDIVTYERSHLVNIFGTTGGTVAQRDGSTVNFADDGTPSYVNDGCTAPIIPFEINAVGIESISGTQNFCPGDIFNLNVSIQGVHNEIIWEGNNGTFSANNVESTNYTSALTDNMDFYIYVTVISNCSEVLKDSILFVVNDSPIVNPAGPFSTFSGIQLITANIAGGTWSADCGVCINSSTGVFDPSISGEGTFEICYTAACGTDCITILVVDGDCLLDFTLNSSSPTCFDASDGDISVNTSGASGTVFYLITNSLGIQMNTTTSSPTANNLNEGWYYISVTDDNCTVIDSIFIDDPEEIQIDFTAIDPNCYGFANGVAFVDTVYEYTGNYNQLVFQWSQGSVGNNVVTNDTLYNIGENTFYITVTDINNCQKTYSFEINYPDSLYFEELGFFHSVCRNEIPFDNGQGQVYASANGGSNGTIGTNYTYLWIELETGATSTNSTWGNKNPGYYTIIATNDLGCSISQTIYLDSLSPEAIFDLTSPDFTSAYTGTAIVNIELVNNSINYAFSNNPNADTTFIWSFGIEGETPYITSNINEVLNYSYPVAGIYEICLVVIENLNGCIDTTCQSIEIFDPPYLDIPNVFSPNNDGVNDLFFFPSQAIEEFTCTIYDRWGKQVYVFDSIDDQWDGIHYLNGRMCTEGVYFYLYEGKSTNGTEYKGQGNLQLIR